MRFEIQMVIASVLLATGIAASASTAGTNATRNYGKRDLSDSSYDTLAIIHASSKVVRSLPLL